VYDGCEVLSYIFLYYHIMWLHHTFLSVHMSPSSTKPWPQPPSFTSLVLHPSFDSSPHFR
jgi:hypothetical protein